MTPEIAWDWLFSGGFLCEPNSLSGLVVIVRLPQKRELNTFVLAIKTLGAWSVGDGSRVYMTKGSSPDQLAFRLVEREDSMSRYIAHSRQLTGKPHVHHGYITDRQTGSVTPCCERNHRKHPTAQACAEKKAACISEAKQAEA